MYKKNLEHYKYFVWSVIFFLLFSLSVYAQDKTREVALITEVSESYVITEYDIALRTDMEKNRIIMKAGCKIYNQGDKPLQTLDFDLFAWEQKYAVTVEVITISRLLNGQLVPVSFTHQAIPRPDDLSQEGTNQYPRIIRVELDDPLGKGQEVWLQFDYIIQHVDPKKTDIHYRIIAELPNETKEICLITDFSWIPHVTWDYEKVSALSVKNFFPKMSKPAWKISLDHPASHKSMVIDGKLEKEMKKGNRIISLWSSCTGGLPQLMIGDSDLIEIKDKDTSVVFLLPKEGYDPPTVEAMGHFLIKAYWFYCDLFGSLNGKAIRIAVSSAGMGGHGAFLGSFLNPHAFQKREEDTDESTIFDDTAAHELAHSWWGISACSYGRGTKFLREAFCNFGTWHLARENYGMDRFQEALATLFYRKIAKYPLMGRQGDNQNLAYTKGALVLEILRKEMGDAVFYEVLKEFFMRYKDKYVTFVDFVSVCNEISKRDWMPFLVHWCYGEGYPVYHLAGFESKKSEEGWETSVTIKNDGKGLVTCPLELQMGEEKQVEHFFVEEGKEEILTYQTSAQVNQVIVDPEHDTYQGDEKEANEKVMALKSIYSTWLNYWAGILHFQKGNQEKGIDSITKSIKRRERGSGKAHPAFYFSRGIANLLTEKKEMAQKDLRNFISTTLEMASQNADQALGTLAYAGILSGNLSTYRNQLQKILLAVTGENIPFDPQFKGWMKWWETHQDGFRVSSKAASLTPAGIK